jgi:PAS domain S-box-containing protein
MSDDLKRQLASLPREVRVLLAEVPAAMAYIDRTQRFRFANERFESWTAAAFPEGVAGHSVAEISGERYPEVLPYVERALEGRFAMHEEMVQGPDGQPHWLRTLLVPDLEDGEVRGYVMMATDITRSRRAEQELERERQEHAMRLERTVVERTAQLRELQRDWSTPSD